MRIRRTMPPAAAILTWRDLCRGLSEMTRNGIGARLEEDIRNFFGAKHVFLVSSGKAALALILKGLSSLRPRKKVLIPAYTCYSVPSAIVKCGMEIVLCDVERDTLDFDYAHLERLADEETLCVIPTHLFGISSDVSRVRRICGDRGIFVVEDAAQAMGVEQAGRKLGTLGDVGFFSLGRGKNITCGSGGIILTSSMEIGETIRKFHRELGEEPVGEYLRNIAVAFLMKVFLNPYLYWFPNGLPFLGIGETRYSPGFPMYRLSNFKAGLLVSWRERIGETNRRRTTNGRLYAEALALRKEGKIYSKDLPFLRFPVYATNPQAKARMCERYGHIGVSPMYPDSINRIEQLRECLAGAGCPGAEWIARTLMTLPTHFFLTEEDRVKVCKNVEGFIAGTIADEASLSVDRCQEKDIKRAGG